MEIENPKPRIAQFDPPDLPPIVAVEVTATGWRALTKDGAVLNVEPSRGHAIVIPYGGRVAVNRNGQPVGYRRVPERASPGLIDRYLRCFDMSRRAAKSNHLPNALLAIDTALSFVETLTARYNRGMILLELGHWREGFADYSYAMEYKGSMFARPQYCACLEYGLTRWRNEDIRNKRLLLIHDHGFGDSIMMLRYVPMLKAMGADVVLWLPPELERLGAQCAPVVDAPVSADYFCPLLFLLEVLQQDVDTIPPCPYLAVDPELVLKWRQRLNLSERLVGVAWAPGVMHANDYPRAIPLGLLTKALPGVRLISVQQQGEDEAVAAGVEHHSFEDFADCAALMSCCDEIVTIDTAAVHLAGAIGHPHIKLLLSHWASWRWLSRLYQNMKICRQDEADDWASALAKL
jgi:hypothetical protein